MSIPVPRRSFRRFAVVALLVVTLPGVFAEAAVAKRPDRTAPTAPTVTATAQSPASIELTWTASTDNVGVTNYLVYRDGATTATATVDGSTLTYTDGSLAPASTHGYVVKARDKAGNVSDASNTATATTLDDTTAPSAPTALSAMALSASQIDLSWGASSDDGMIADYLVYRDGTLTATVSASTLTYSDSGLSASTTYSYTVQARDAAGNVSASSNAASATTSAASSRPVGYSAHMLSQADVDAYADLARDGGSTSIRDEIAWVDIESSRGVFDWTKGDSVVTHAAKRGLRPLLLVGTSPQWASGVSTLLANWWWAPPTDPADYANFVGKVAARYGSTGTFWAENPRLPKVLPAAIEVWNEPNISTFWVGSDPDPVRYTALLSAAYPAIKAADPSMTVVSAGLAPKGGYNDADCNGVTDSGSTGTRINPVNFLETMYVAGAHGSLDAVGWHPYNYNNGSSAEGMLSYHACSAWSQMEQTPVSVRSLMTQYGDDSLSVWATELGAPTCVAGAEYACVTEAEQGKLATQEMNAWNGFTWSGGYFWYDLRDDYGGDSASNPEEHFGAVRADNSLKPAYSALRTAWAS